MEASIFGIIAEGFIPCVDDCPAELYPFVSLRHNMIGTLGDLETYKIVTSMVGISKFEDFFVSTNTTGTRVNLPRDEEGQERGNNDLIEGDVSPELIVFVTAESRSCEMIDIVFEEGNIVLQPNIVKNCDNQLLDGSVVGD